MFSVYLIMPSHFSVIWYQYHNCTLINIIEQGNNVVICICCRTCVKQCEEIGCIDQQCFPQCKFSSDGVSVDQPWYMQEPLYLKWKQWDCQSDCRYHCMVKREGEREALGYHPVKYHGKWPFKRIYGIQVCFTKLLKQLMNLELKWYLFIFMIIVALFAQEPVSVAFSALNLSMHFHGWLSFFILLYYKLPLRQDKKAYYEFASLWHIYALFSMNSWFWSAVFHSR